MVELLVLDDTTVNALVAERQRLGLDRFDEVHTGRYVINPAPNFQHATLVAKTIVALSSLCDTDEDVGDSINVGVHDDYRVTDVCVITRAAPDGLYATSGHCRVAGEVLSPTETPIIKQRHYQAHGVGLYIEIDPMNETVRARDLAGWHRRAADVAAVLAETLGYAIA